MYMNAGYLNHSHMDFKDKSRPLIVGSCGTYRLSSLPKLPTYRPRGRLDYQIIYITAGCVHFHFDNVDNEMCIRDSIHNHNDYHFPVGGYNPHADHLHLPDTGHDSQPDAYLDSFPVVPIQSIWHL